MTITLTRLLLAAMLTTFACGPAGAVLVAYFPGDGPEGTFANSLDDTVDDFGHPITDGVSNVDDVATYVNDPTRGMVVNSPGNHRWLAGTQGIDLTTGFTWSLWVKVDPAETAPKVVIGTRNGSWHKITVASGVDGSGFVDFASGDYNLANDTWTHIGYIGSDNGTGNPNSVEVQLYINGSYVDQDTSAVALTYDGQMEIGGSTRFSEYANLLMDDIAIWNERLSVDDIMALAAGADPTTIGGPDFLLGDLNDDGTVDTLDIDPFVLLLTDPAGYATAFPGVDAIAVGDINMDTMVDTLDIDPFVTLLTSGGLTGGGAVPEPTAMAMLASAACFGLWGLRKRGS